MKYSRAIARCRPLLALRNKLSGCDVHTADGLATQVVTHQLQVERRTAKERWPETDVLPLSHADQPV